MSNLPRERQPRVPESKHRVQSLKLKRKQALKFRLASAHSSNRSDCDSI